MSRRLILYLSVVITTVCNFGCISFGFGKADNLKEESSSEVSSESMVSLPGLTIQDSLPEWLWETFPEKDALVFIAHTPRYSNNKLEKQKLLQKAARQVGVFEDFWGANQDILIEKGYTTQTAQRTRAQYNARAEDAAMSNLELLLVKRYKNGVWGKYRIKRPGLPGFNWQPNYMNGKPSWIISPPLIPGWFVAVANGRKQSTIARSLQKADEEALAEIINQVHGNRLTVDKYRHSGSKNSSQTNVVMRSEGKGFGIVRGFLVIARWYDGSNAWSLAVCPEDWN